MVDEGRRNFVKGIGMLAPLAALLPFAKVATGEETKAKQLSILENQKEEVELELAANQAQIDMSQVEQEELQEKLDQLRAEDVTEVEWEVGDKVYCPVHNAVGEVYEIGDGVFEDFFGYANADNHDQIKQMMGDKLSEDQWEQIIQSNVVYVKYEEPISAVPEHIFKQYVSANSLEEGSEEYKELQTYSEYTSDSFVYPGALLQEPNAA